MPSPNSHETLPIALVCADVLEIHPYQWHAAPGPYLKAVATGSNAIPLIYPSFGNEISVESALDRVDGVLLTGARSNVHPAKYGETALPEHGPYDSCRDETTLQLANSALERGIPLLAICRGMQELNVALGGTLNRETQELDGRFDHRATESKDNDIKFGLAHPIFPNADCSLAKIIGNDPVQVNSLHRQSIATLADNLAVEATAEDGTIESVSVKNARGFALAVQWHPEYWVETDKASRKIFEAFGTAMRDYRQSSTIGSSNTPPN